MRELIFAISIFKHFTRTYFREFRDFLTLRVVHGMHLTLPKARGGQIAPPPNRYPELAQNRRAGGAHGMVSVVLYHRHTCRTEDGSQLLKFSWTHFGTIHSPWGVTGGHRWRPARHLLMIGLC